jgi:succinate dehydrogenase/fumarate reductase flavoprotein subunit
VLPLYADLSRLPETERRAIFGLSVGNEGKTRAPVYEALTKAGFDPDRDLLQAPVMHPGAYGHANFWAGMTGPHWRQWTCGGLLVDWDLRTSLEGLYAAGGAIFGGGAHSSAAASGRYVGRLAAAGAKVAPEPQVDPQQIAREKARLYAPLADRGRGIGWKELNAGIDRVMQDYCGAYKSEPVLRAGLDLLQGLRESEATTVTAANPHELAHALECDALITAGEAVVHASLARHASSDLLNFVRLDYPEVDPPAWRKHLAIRTLHGDVQVRDLPLDYHLQPPYAPGYEENYRLHSNVLTFQRSNV